MTSVKIPLPLLLLITITLSGCGGNTPTMQSGSNASSGQASNSKAADETAALDAIAKISDAQSNYFRRNRRYALTFDELIEAHLLNSAPSAAQTGYDFSLRPAADAQTYKLSVNPTVSAPTARHFFSDESGTVHAETGKDASTDSPKI
jgi:uncharacterized lipoprotein YmbA